MNFSFLQPANLEESRDFLQKRELKDNENDTRAKILSCWESIDVPSCPGSGKTTILVTKLAWAIERWKMDDMGICVLSHTNVAKEEIRKRLTSNQVNKLLGYPHFVGTIHEFFNKFLAIPWLKTNNIPIRLIDNDIAFKKCFDAIWKVGQTSKFDQKYKKNFLWQNHTNYEGLTELSWYIDDAGEFQLSGSDKRFLEFQKLIKGWSTKQGYHTHDDMIAFSNKLLSQYGNLASILCSRFPIVLIDEAQDTNEAQSKLLNKLFDPDITIVQRFGDDDQQIYDFGEKTTTDSFPNLSRVKCDLKLCETQRCSPLICAVASKFSLSGQIIYSVVERECEQPQPHLILFDKSTVEQVIPKFAELVREEIKLTKDSIIKVVGQIGKDNPEDKHFPYSICHYEPTYVKPCDKRVGRPKNLHDLINNCRSAFSEKNENYQAINIFFSGIARLLSDQLEVSFTTGYPYRNVRDQLEKENLNSNGFKGKELLQGLNTIFNAVTISESNYLKIKSDLEELLKRTGFNNYTESFFELSDKQTKKIQNRFYVGDIPIELNTIAGIKGETSSATLVLETFYRCHNIENAILVVFKIIKPNLETPKRIRNLYVSMTRPTDFLCLALPKNEYDELCSNPEIKNWLETSFKIKDVS